MTTFLLHLVQKTNHWGKTVERMHSARRDHLPVEERRWADTRPDNILRNQLKLERRRAKNKVARRSRKVNR